MASNRETTFEEFQVDERFKKLKRSFKLAMLRKTHSDDGGMSVGINQSSISSINVDSLDSNCVIPSLQTCAIKSEILASSNNLRNLVLTKRNYKANQGIMTTSSVKQDDYLDDRHIMPPPRRNTVYRTPKETQNKVPTLSNYGSAASDLLHRSIQSSTVNNLSLENSPSCISHASPSFISNTDTNKVYSHSLVAPMKCTNDIHIIERIFLKWKVMLNDHYELIIKGTLECGKVARSKPVIRRYSATCVESKYKHIYSLKGNIVDERNVLPDYIRGKFHNGFPDDWENVHQIWRTYVSQGCPVTFRWPTPITDSDDDLKSELTELTYIRTTNNKTIPMKTYNTIECINSENPSNTSSKNEEKRNYSHSFQRCEENTLFVKPLVSNSKKDITPIPQTRNIELAHDEDKQNIDLDVNPLLPEISFIVMNKLKDVIREDKLHIIINNLANKNCSPKYIDKIIELFKCSDYIVSYRAKSECNGDSAVFMNCGTSSKFETIPLQSSLSCNDNPTNINKLENHININKFENNIMEQSKNYMPSTDLRCGSIRNDCNSIQSSNSINIKQQHDNNNDSNESESETYGVPKISEIGRILHAQKASKKIYKHKVRKKPTNSQCNAKEIEHKFTHAANPITNNNKSVSDASDISITEDETEARKRYERMNIAQKSREDTFYRYSGIRKNNFDVHGANKPVMQNEQSLDTLEAQRVNFNVFVKEQKAPHRVQENAHSQFVPDIDYTINSDIDVSTNKQKKDENMRGLHSNLDQEIVINSKSNSNFENPPVLRESRREFIEQPKSETVRAKPNIISSMPVNLKLRIKKIDSKLEQFKREQAEQASNVIIVENEERKQYSNIQPSEEIQKKKSISKPSTQTVANDKICSITNKENESNINSTNLKPTMMTNPTIEQSKNNELKVENNRKVLCSWVPKVIYYAKSKFELGLIFEGKLLNEAGHVVHRKFTTDIILKRLSPMLIETVNHEFYELSGHLKDNKYVIPKELAKQCRNGCPANIEQFCLTWKRLQSCKIQEMNEKPHNTSMNSLNTFISSRGRRIIPSLSYWTGERITLKDNNLVYNPGSSQESSLQSLIETSIEALGTEETKKQKVNSKNTSKEQKLLPNSNEIPSTNKNRTIVIETIQASNKSPKTKAANSTKRSYKLNKSQKPRIKRRMKQNLISSTDSSEEEHKVPPPKRVHTQLNTETPSQYTMTLRKRYDRGIPE